MAALYGPKPSLDSLTTEYLRGIAVTPTPSPQPGGPGLRICDPRRQGGPAISPGTCYPLVALYDTRELRKLGLLLSPVTTRGTKYYYDNEGKKGRACSAHGEMRNAYKFESEKLKIRDHMDDLGMDGRIILKCILNSF
jgi:hypothetical protein